MPMAISMPSGILRLSLFRKIFLDHSFPGVLSKTTNMRFDGFAAVCILQDLGEPILNCPGPGLVHDLQLYELLFAHPLKKARSQAGPSRRDRGR